jgi:hypothetical protein
MRKLAIVLILAFALFTFLSAYSSDVRPLDAIENPVRTTFPGK